VPRYAARTFSIINIDENAVSNVRNKLICYVIKFCVQQSKFFLCSFMLFETRNLNVIKVNCTFN
jgi:hypothetical protein